MCIKFEKPRDQCRTTLCKDKYFIEKIPNVSCRNCVSYDPEKNRCERFKTRNIVTGTVVYDYIGLCRADETKCGEKGKYYIEKIED